MGPSGEKKGLEQWQEIPGENFKICIEVGSKSDFTNAVQHLVNLFGVTELLSNATHVSIPLSENTDYYFL